MDNLDVTQISYSFYFLASLVWAMACLGETVRLKEESEEAEKDNDILRGPWVIDIRWVGPAVNTFAAIFFAICFFFISI